jgi:tetratricopeptide (TPR) repeat protein
MPRGLDAAQRAVALDSSLAEAHNALAMALLMGSSKTDEAEREFLRALELSPFYVQARDWYALFYLQQAAGRLEQGVEQAKLAVECDPLSGYANAILGLTYFCGGNNAEAETVLRRAVELDPESFLVYVSLLAVLGSSARFEEAIKVGERALAMSGRHPWAMGFLATTLADWGKFADAGALYDELIARARRGYVQCSSLAMAAAAAGLDDEAVRHARQAFAIGDPMAPIFFGSHWPLSARVRACSGFCQTFRGLVWDSGSVKL